MGTHETGNMMDIQYYTMICCVRWRHSLNKIFWTYELPMIFPWSSHDANEEVAKIPDRRRRLPGVWGSNESGPAGSWPKILKPRSQWTTSLAPCHMLWKILHCAFDGEIFSEIIWSNRAHVLDKLSPSEKNMDQYQGKKPYRTWIFWKRTLPMKPQVAGVPTLAMGQPMSR